MGAQVDRQARRELSNTCLPSPRYFVKPAPREEIKKLTLFWEIPSISLITRRAGRTRLEMYQVGSYSTSSARAQGKSRTEMVDGVFHRGHPPHVSCGVCACVACGSGTIGGSHTTSTWRVASRGAADRSNCSRAADRAFEGSFARFHILEVPFRVVATSSASRPHGKSQYRRLS